MGNTTSITEKAFEPAAAQYKNPKRNPKKPKKKRPETPGRKLFGYNLPTKALKTPEKQEAAEKRKANKENREARRNYSNIMKKLFQDRKNTPQRAVAKRQDKERKNKTKKQKKEEKEMLKGMKTDFDDYVINTHDKINLKF